MTRCNYIAFNPANLEPLSPYLDELFDLDVLCNEEGIDPISFGATVGAAMELYDLGIITQEKIGVDARFGSAEALCKLVEMTAQWREVLLQPNFDLFIHQLSHFIFFKKQKAEPPKERPKLSLKPRSVPVEEGVAPVAEAPAAPVVSERPPAAAAAPVSSAAIFGGAKPVDTAARERAIEERLKEKQMKEREPIRGRETDRHE